MSVNVTFREERQKWQVTYVFDGKRKRPLFAEKKEAENFARKIGLGLRPEDQNSITLSDAGKKYFHTDSVKKSKKSMANDQRYINLLYHFMSYERGIDCLKTIELVDMEAFRDWLIVQKEFDDRPMNMGASSVNRCLRVLKHFFKRQIQWGEISQNPSQYLSLLESDPKERKCMSADQYQLMIQKLRSDFIPALDFMFLTGAPASSVARLTWADVDLPARQFLMLRKKGRQAKWKKTPIAMSEPVFTLLVRLRNSSISEDGSVFKDFEGRPLLADRITREGNEAVRAAGIKGRTLYGLRHALGSDMTNANIATEIVRQALGHASIQTTQRYANKIASKTVGVAIDLVRGGSLVANKD